MRHQCRCQILWSSQVRPRLRLLQWLPLHHQMLFDVHHPNAKGPSWSSRLWWLWYDHTLLPVRWVGQACRCTLPKVLCSIGPFQGIYGGCWLWLAVLVRGLPVPFLLWFNTICREHISQILGFCGTEFWFSGIYFEARISQPGQDLP